MRRMFAGATTLVLAGCATEATQPQREAGATPAPASAPVVRLIDQQAPPVSEILQAANSAPACSNVPGETEFDPSRYKGVAQRTFDCLPVFPELAMKARFAGACLVLFDVDDAGRPLLPEARCNVGNQHGPASADWRSAARIMYERAALRAVETSRFSPKSSERPDEGRSSLRAVYRFDLKSWPGSADVQVPTAFQRPPPAPTLPICPPSEGEPSSQASNCPK